MAKRTYLPTLVFLARGVQLFVAKYRKRIIEGLPEGGEVVLDLLLNAIDQLLSLIDIETGD